MAMAYGLGASVVIIGALFKILHWPFANLMLIVGMGTEAIIFALSAFEPVHEDLDWTLVYPELAGLDSDKAEKGLGVSQQLDKMLDEAKVGPELIQGLGTGLRSLTENVGQMADLSGATVATKEYAENLYKANESLSGMNSSYSRAIAALDSLTTSTESFAESASSIQGVNQSLAEFDRNLKNLNNIYGGMLSAMRPASS